MNITGHVGAQLLEPEELREITLQLIIVQYAHAYGPNARFMNAKRSYGLPLYQAMKNSIAYA